MTVERFDLREIAPQRWKNGAGVTREIAFAGRGRADFDWRLSVAEVDAAAPFSVFAGVDRCIVLLRGAGLRLRARDGSIDHVLTEPLAPFRFSGDASIDASPLGDRSSDFNAMTRRGVFRSEVSSLRGVADLQGGDGATLLLGCTGAWAVTTPDGEVQSLGAMHALLWRAPVAALRIEPRDPAATLLFVRLCHDRRP